MAKLCSVFFLLLGFVSNGFGNPAELWPVAIKTADDDKLRSSLDSATLPPELKPAVQFQKTFLKIIAARQSKTLPTEGLQDLKAFVAADKEDAPVAHGVAEAARAWIARTQMQQIDTALRQYYRKNVRFPEALTAVEPNLSEAIRLDPWGQPWSYQPCAPEGFSKLAAQRYRLGPAALPALAPFAQAIGDRNPAAPAWKVASRGTKETKVLEFRTGNGTHLIQPGGKVDNATLLYIGDNWALLAWPDQLFAITF